MLQKPTGLYVRFFPIISRYIYRMRPLTDADYWFKIFRLYMCFLGAPKWIGAYRGSRFLRGVHTGTSIGRAIKKKHPKNTRQKE